MADNKEPERDDLSNLNVDDTTPDKERDSVEKASKEEGLSVPKTLSRDAGDETGSTVAGRTTDWEKVPVDTYWFSKAAGRSPLPDETRMWEFELVVFDVNNQQSRLFAKVHGTYLPSLLHARAKWDLDIANAKDALRAKKIIILSP